MVRFLNIIVFLAVGFKVFSQESRVSGILKDENESPIGYAPVAIIYQSDQTLAHFCITDEQGVFRIKGVKKGEYILQVSFIGNEAIAIKITIPLPDDGNLGTLIMKQNPIALGEVEISAEYVPLRIKKDTLEFNTAAFATRPDAVVEDLLKKMPGIEVDRAGNIKALGEDVTKVLVDGREFFGSDYKLATRNLQADALEKIQVFDKRSEETEFTGIDDGIRAKTLNLLLKEEKKNTFFGELLGGYGTVESFQSNARSYRFTNKDQVAALGMLNNISQFGFSLKDYVDFTEGSQNSGGHSTSGQPGMPSVGRGSFPENFGKPLNGISMSGAAGLNYSRQYNRNNRIFMSFIANGSDRDLIQSTSTRNYSEINTFQQEDSLSEKKSDRATKFNFGLRNRIDSSQFIIVNGTISLSDVKIKTASNSLISNSESEKNTYAGFKTEKSYSLAGVINGSYLKLLDRGRTVFTFSSDAYYSKESGNSDWQNNSFFYNPENWILSRQFQDNLNLVSAISASTSVIQKIGKMIYIKPELKAGDLTESLCRFQGIEAETEVKTDSLSPDFRQQYKWLKPQISFIRNSAKSQFAFSLEMETGKNINSLNRDYLVNKDHYYFTPGLKWEYSYKSGKKVRLYYKTGVNIPSLSQTLPVANITNPLVPSYGNRNLKPELYNNLYLNWWIFDQFSFTSFMTSINTTYTRDKINWNRIIDNNLRQSMSLINVADDYRIQSITTFSTPIKKLGAKVNISIEETWNQGLSYINGIENRNTNLIHKVSMGLENRIKTKWDIRIGAGFQLTDAKFSLQKSLNNIYTDLSYFTELRYKVGSRFNFLVKTDVTNYNSRSFSDAISIPLLGAEATYAVFKNNRGTFMIQGFDLLNRNTGIERTSELNFLRERRSNMPGRFLMLSFKYRFQRV